MSVLCYFLPYHRLSSSQIWTIFEHHFVTRYQVNPKTYENEPSVLPAYPTYTIMHKAIKLMAGNRKIVHIYLFKAMRITTQLITWKACLQIQSILQPS